MPTLGFDVLNICLNGNTLILSVFIQTVGGAVKFLHEPCLYTWYECILIAAKLAQR
jgi:hypothetical protein